jgi:hypothetical protein
MNNRIFEIANQVLPREDHLIEGDPKVYAYFFSSHELVQFAELIVRECAKSVDKVYEDAEPVYGRNDCSIFAQGIDVLKHFGLDN